MYFTGLFAVSSQGMLCIHIGPNGATGTSRTAGIDKEIEGRAEKRLGERARSCAGRPMGTEGEGSTGMLTSAEAERE